MDSEKKLVLVTGVTRGIGKALTRQFIKLGHTVVGCARTTSQIRSLREEFGDPNDFYAVDVSSNEEVKSWASLVINSHGVPDIIVNNAAVINLSNPLWDVPSEEFDKVIDVNIKGTANIIRHFVPVMVKNRNGVIVNFSSGWGRSADAEVAPYCASKWAIEGMTLSLSMELPSPMAAVALSPGCVNTEMLQTCFGGDASNHKSSEEWAKSGANFILGIDRSMNGTPQTHSP